jgi:purine catabolism regulator
MSQWPRSGVEVADLLTLPAFVGTEVVGGASGLDRKVTGVNVMEVPDIEQFIHPGEMLLTTAYPVRDRPDGLAGLLRAAAARGLAAVAIKPLRYVPDISAPVADLADELGLPLLRLPAGMSFNLAMGAVLSTVLTDYGPEPGPVEAMREQLSEAVLGGGGFTEIARALQAALDEPVTIVDDQDAVIGQAGSPGLAENAARLGREFPISVAGVQRGAIWVEATELTLGQQRLVHQACFAAGLHLAQLTAAMELDWRLQVLVLEELISSSPHVGSRVGDHLHLLGALISGPLCVVLAECGDVPDQLELVQAASEWGDALVWGRVGEIVAIMSLPDGNNDPVTLRALLRQWQVLLRSHGAVVEHVAAGTVVDDPAGLPDSHSAARAALRIAQASKVQLASYDDLLLDRLVFDTEPELLDLLITRNIGPLIEYDENNSGDLCRTLWYYLGTGSGAVAARHLYIHYNTLKHRLARIDELLGVDLADPRTRLRLLFALEVSTLRTAVT